MIEIVNASFKISASSLQNSPNSALSEVVFLGRSNVGKSSFINKILQKNSLAKTANTPGKTRLINYFDAKFKIDENSYANLYFVDLPGYGYAKVSKKMANEWQKNLDEFLKSRPNIRVFVHLRDSRQFDMKLDLDVNNYIKSFLKNDQVLLNFYTKSDKINQSEKSAVLRFDKNAFFISSLKNQGINEARDLIVKKALGL